MTNTLTIDNPETFIWTLENTLASVEVASSEAARSSILNRQTVRGIIWAIAFMKGLNTDHMDEKQLNHAIRLTYFRGNTCPSFNN